VGRKAIASTVQRLAQEGAWGVSPHVIPQHSLHAVAGTVSLALRAHGPNFGVGGGPRACDDAFLAVAALVADETLPGVWLLLTGHDTEWLPAENGRDRPAAEAPACEAVALALVPISADGGLTLRIGPEAVSKGAAGVPEFRLSEFAGALGDPGKRLDSAWRLPGGGWFELIGTFHGAEGER
jgi:hypothetical protein